MKMLLLGLMIISTSAFAQNSEVDQILTKYSSSLYNIKLGQSWTTIISEQENETRTELIETSIILKVMGSKYYQVTHSLNSQTQKTEVRVVLEDAKERGEPVKFDSIEVENDILTVTADVKNEISEVNLFGRKNLLSPIMCDSLTIERARAENYFYASSHSSHCGGILSVQKLKLIDLKDVEFCDENDECKIRDMSHLTSDL